MEQEIQLNEHNKQEYPPMHTAEHLLNSQMVKYFHCERSFSAHIEKKKSKCDYHFKTAPSAEDIATVEQAVNDIIQQNINVEEIFYPIDQVPAGINLTRLPEPGIKTVRVIRIGDYAVLTPSLEIRRYSVLSSPIWNIGAYLKSGVFAIMFFVILNC